MLCVPAVIPAVHPVNQAIMAGATPKGKLTVRVVEVRALLCSLRWCSDCFFLWLLPLLPTCRCMCCR